MVICSSPFEFNVVHYIISILSYQIKLTHCKGRGAIGSARCSGLRGHWFKPQAKPKIAKLPDYLYN
jgi:hypothetical protein